MKLIRIGSIPPCFIIQHAQQPCDVYDYHFQGNVGRLPAYGGWVLGILVKDNVLPPRPIFRVVPNRSKEVLLQLIYTYLYQGTSIDTDGWPAYRTLGRYYRHRVVNHSQHFVDPVSGRCNCWSISFFFGKLLAGSVFWWVLWPIDFIGGGGSNWLT